MCLLCHFLVCDKQFPPCALTEEDLIQNPYFSKLLLSLSQHLDESGLSLALAKEQAQVRPLEEGMAGGRAGPGEGRVSDGGFVFFGGVE